MGCGSTTSYIRKVQVNESLAQEVRVKSPEVEQKIIEIEVDDEPGVWENIENNNLSEQGKENNQRTHEETLNRVKKLELGSKTELAPDSSHDKNAALISRTEKIDFGNYPHEFDFSFLEDHIPSEKDQEIDSLYKDILAVV